MFSVRCSFTLFPDLLYIAALFVVVITPTETLHVKFLVLKFNKIVPLSMLLFHYPMLLCDSSFDCEFLADYHHL